MVLHNPIRLLLPTPYLLLGLYYSPKIIPTFTHPQDCNCNVCWNICSLNLKADFMHFPRCEILRIKILEMYLYEDKSVQLGNWLYVFLELLVKHIHETIANGDFASLCLSVHLSIPPCGTAWLPLGGFLWNLILWYVLKSVDRVQMWLKLDNIPGTLHEDWCTFVSLVFVMATGCVVCGIQAKAEEAFMI